jgi:hypothetical protein
MKLNLGCMGGLLEGYENVDTFHVPGAQVVDLEWSWPWSDNSAEEIQANHVLERLYNKTFTMNEAWRVLRHGGLLAVSVWTTDGPGAWADPGNLSYWNRRSFDYYEEGSEKRTRYASRYGIAARFTVTAQAEQDTPEGPVLLLLLRAVKDQKPAVEAPEEETADVF